MSDTEKIHDLEKAGAVRSWFAGSPRAPVSMELSPVMACNVNCLFCRRKDELKTYYQNHSDVSDERWCAIVEEAVRMGARRILFRGGGEPMLRRRLFLRLFPLVAQNRAVEFSVLTNGTLVDERIAEGLVESGWHELTVSLHGGDPATHDLITDQPGSFEKVARSLSLINRFKRLKGGRGPALSFHMVLTRKSYAGIDGLIDFAREHGVSSVGIFPMHNAPYPAYVKDLEMRPEDDAAYRQLLTGYVRRLEGYGIAHCAQLSYQGGNEEWSPSATVPKLEVPRLSAELADPVARLPCYFPWSHATITPDGTLAPCCYGENFQPKASLHKMSFKEAWLGHELAEYRSEMMQGRLMPFCKNCPNWYQRDNHRLREIFIRENSPTDDSRRIECD